MHSPLFHRAGSLFKGSLGAVSHAWLACSLLAAASGLLLTACMTREPAGPDRNELATALIEATGTYRIVSVHSGKAVDVDAPTGKVQMWTWHGGSNQRWNLVHVGGGRHEIRNAATGKCLDIDYNAANPAANGQKAQTWTCHGGANQRFYIEAITPGGPGGDNYFIIPAYTDMYSSTVLDLKDWSTANGASLQQWTRGTANGNFQNNQYWKVEAL